MKNAFRFDAPRRGPSILEADPPESSGPRRITERFWHRLDGWIRANTSVPHWLPAYLRFPVFGYLVAVTLESIAVALTLLLRVGLPGFTLYGILPIMAVVVVAISWGGGPGLVATLTGVVLLKVLIVPPPLPWSLATVTEVVSLGLTLGVGLLASLLAGQVAQARRQADRAREFAETRAAELSTIFETLVDGVFVYDQEGHIIAHNAAVRAQLGMNQVPDSVSWTPEEWGAHLAPRDVQGQPIPPEQTAPMRILRGEVFTGEAPCEEWIQTLDGREVFASVTGAPIHNRQGQIIGAVLVGRDVTERRQLEQEVAARARQLEATIEAIPDGVALYDPQAYWVLMNRAGKRILGIEADPASFPSRPHPERMALLNIRDKHGHPFPPERSPIARGLLGEVVSDAESEDMVITALNGQERQLSTTGAPIWDAQGNRSGAVFVFRDVTERRRLERRTQQALNALMQLAQTLFAEPAPASALPSLLADRLAEFTHEMLGQEQVTLVSLDPETGALHPLAAFGLTPEQEAQWHASLKRFHRGAWCGPEASARLDAGEVVQVDFTQTMPDQAPSELGGSRHLLAPLRVGQRLLGFLTVGRVSALPAFTAQEEALLGAVAHLCALVLERERLLGEREEARAQALALEEANKRMDGFLGIASHELKTPLTSIKLGIQMVCKQAEFMSRCEVEGIERVPRLRERLALVEQQIERLEWLINDLLDVSRIQAGHWELRSAPADLVAIVRCVVEEQQEAAPTRLISWQPPVAGSLPVRVDALRIGQVVMNYLTNALKYSPEDQPVEVGIEAASQVARVWVRDAGPGIPLAEQERIWERFHRVPGMEVQSGSGVGLGVGLYISRTIIEGHGGQVGVQSAPGAGATFWFALPLASSRE